MQGNPKTDCRKPKNKKNSARASLHVHAGLMILYVLHAYADPPAFTAAAAAAAATERGRKESSLITLYSLNSTPLPCSYMCSPLLHSLVCGVCR